MTARAMTTDADVGAPSIPTPARARIDRPLYLRAPLIGLTAFASVRPGAFNLLGVLASSGAVAFGVANALLLGQGGGAGVDWDRQVHSVFAG